MPLPTTAMNCHPMRYPRHPPKKRACTTNQGKAPGFFGAPTARAMRSTSGGMGEKKKTHKKRE